MKPPRHDISDHAVLRYLERAQGVDVERVRREIGRRIDAATEGQDGMNAVILDGMRFALQGSVVTTCWRQHLPKRGPSAPRERDGDE